MGDLTLHLRGSSSIATGTSTVMGQALANSAIVGGDTLTVTGDPGASLESDGMFSMKNYVQKSGSVTITLSNGHSRITKWAMYINESVTIEGGTLAASSVGAKKNGAVMLDAKAFTVAPGAELYEGDYGTLTQVSVLKLTNGPNFNTRNYIKIVLPDVQGGITPLPSDENNPFTDVPAGAYYHDAVLWAVDKGVTTGMTDTTFAPDKTCTRAQVATFLWRALGEPEPAGGNDPFDDVKPDAYYYKAVLWAVERGITDGTSDTTFSPERTCTSAQVITFLWRSNGSPAAGGKSVLAERNAGQYYTDAVAWADVKGVLRESDPVDFAPGNESPRADIVTYLYRNAGSPGV